MNEELWRPVDQYEVYEISNLGRLRRRNRFLRTFVDHSGYQMTHIQNRGRAGRRHVRIHQLVAAAFIGKCPDGFQVNHKNGIKTDNRAENLEYLSPSDNTLHAQKIGRKGIGERHPMAKLTPENVREIRSMRGAFEYREIADRFGIGVSTVSCILSRRIWKHI